MSSKVIVVGARSVRQGTGPFIAAAFAANEADIVGIVGTSNDTVEEARQALAQNQGIVCAGYTNLQDAILAERADIVAICSPYGVHQKQLAAVAEAGCHCLVEKPLMWPAAEQEVQAIVEGFTRRNLLLQMVTQWPTTLSAFTALLGPLNRPITEFAMGLSPISIGLTMVPDSAPHFISLLQALLGTGECEQVNIAIEGDAESDRLTLSCNYRHASGNCRAQLSLATCEQRPRPAWYSINGQRVDREVELPAYNQHLVTGECRATLMDPMEQVVAAFLASLETDRHGQQEHLLAGHRNLVQLAAAWPTDH